MALVEVWERGGFEVSKVLAHTLHVDQLQHHACHDHCLSYMRTHLKNKQGLRLSRLVSLQFPSSILQNSLVNIEFSKTCLCKPPGPADVCDTVALDGFLTYLRIAARFILSIVNLLNLKCS